MQVTCQPYAILIILRQLQLGWDLVFRKRPSILYGAFSQSLLALFAGARLFAVAAKDCIDSSV